MRDWIVLSAMIWSYLLIILIIALVVYVLSSIAHMKALKALGYDKAWMAWIPLVKYYALADVVAGSQQNTTLFGSFSVPTVLYRFWWAPWFVAQFIPMIGYFLSLAISIIFLGNCYVRMYARLDGTSEQEQQVIGYLSGLLPIIAIIKFLAGKYSKI